ncbi:MAG: tetratricopeptide repeat protein [Salibacteraceae bacterium]
MNYLKPAIWGCWLLLVGGLLVSTTFIQANPKVDSLYAIVQDEESEPDQRLLAFRNYILATLYDNTAEALPDLQDYLQLSIQYSDSVRMAHAYHCLGFYHRKKGDLAQADSAIARSLWIAQASENRYYLLNAYIDQACLLEERGAYATATQLYQSILDTAVHYREFVMEARAHINLGNLYEVQGSYLEALDHLQRALQLCEQKKIVGFLASTLLSLGNINAAIGDLSAAEGYYQQAIAVSEKQHNNNTFQLALIEYADLLQKQERSALARQTLQQLLQLSERLPNRREQARAHYLLAEHYLETKAVETAKGHQQKALQLLGSYPNALETAYAHQVSGRLFLQTNANREAQNHCLQADSINRQYNDVELQKSICWCLYEAYKRQQKMAEALGYYEAYSSIVAQQSNTPMVKQLLQKQLETQLQHRLQLDSLQQKAHLQLLQVQHDQEIRLQWTITAVVMLAGALLSFLSLVLWRAYQRNRQQKESLEKMNRLNKQVFSIIAHDFKGPLISMNMLADNLGQKQLNEPSLQRYLRDIRDQVAQTTHIIDNLLNWARAELQLQLHENQLASPHTIAQELIRSGSQKIEAKALKVENLIPPGLEVNLHPDLMRIVLRNLMSNAIKYSHPQGSISLEYLAHSHQLKISDEGVGLSIDQQQHLLKDPVYSQLGTHHETGFGIGLYITSELLLRKGWRLAITGAPGAGCTCFISMPIGG